MTGLGCTTLNISADTHYADYLKLLVILYADDTVLMSESADGLQLALDNLQLYCNEWKLKINGEKTKVVVFCKRKPRRPQWNFILNDTQLDIVDKFSYLGVVFSYNGSFVKCKETVVAKATRAMWCLIKKCRKLSLPPSIQMQLFDQTVVPVLLYGCELWGLGNLKTIETLHLKFCKLVLHVNKSTPSCMVYGELGRIPLENVVKQRIVSFWGELVESTSDRYSCLMYKLCLDLWEQNKCQLPWFNGVKGIFDNTGLSHVWINQAFPNSRWLNRIVKQSLHDQAVQTWAMSVNNSSKCLNIQN
jgi:hypothetical protein